MAKIMFFADATCDMPREFIEKNNIQIIGLRYIIGPIEDGWYTIDGNQKKIDDFYKMMRKGEYGRTSLVTYDDAKTAFEPFFKQGYDILHIGLSSGLALTYKNALDAGEDLAKQYGAKFYAPDTKCVSGMSYFILKQAIKLYNDGKDIDHIREHLPAFYEKICAYFTVDSLTYLQRGGRISAAKKIIGGLLNIKPIFTVDGEGKLVNYAKKNGRLSSIQFIAENVKDIDPANSDIIIVHADCPDDAKVLMHKVLEISPTSNVEIENIGFIIGVHTGPGTIGLCFRKK